MNSLTAALLASAALISSSAFAAPAAHAQTASPAPGAAPAPVVTLPGTPQPPFPATPPKLIVAISVDQFSADLFQQYRNHFTGGMARLLTGAVFPRAIRAMPRPRPAPATRPS
ncbi:hypothetical protein GCM10020258_04110 [Sphingomonas yabuuchiae]